MRNLDGFGGIEDTFTLLCICYKLWLLYIFWKWRSRSCQNCLFHAGRNVSQNHCILLANCKPCALKTLATHRDNNTKSSNVMMQKGFQTLPLSITACQLRRDFWKLHPSRTWHEKIPKILVRHKKDIEILDSLLLRDDTQVCNLLRWCTCQERHKGNLPKLSHHLSKLPLCLSWQVQRHHWGPKFGIGF